MSRRMHCRGVSSERQRCCAEASNAIPPRKTMSANFTALLNYYYFRESSRGVQIGCHPERSEGSPARGFLAPLGMTHRWVRAEPALGMLILRIELRAVA